MKPTHLAKLATLACDDDGPTSEAEDLLDAAQHLAEKASTPALEQFRRAVRDLPPLALRRLQERFQAARQARREEMRAARARAADDAKRDTPRETGGWTLRLEYVLCGKEGCNKQHGPYWYGYRTVLGRTKKKYFGKKKPGAAALAETLGKAGAGELGRALPKVVAGKAGGGRRNNLKESTSTAKPPARGGRARRAPLVSEGRSRPMGPQTLSKRRS